MRWILNILYLLALVLALPFLFIKSRRTGKYRSDWPDRLGRINEGAREKILGLSEPGSVAGDATPGMYRILLHCVSVGELLSMRRLMDELLRRDPLTQIILSTTTDTGFARAMDLYGWQADSRVVPVRYPLDLSFAVDRFLNTVSPHLIVLVELETWPNFVFAAHRRGIPLRIINGRLTARSLRRYRLVRPVIAVMFKKVEHFGVQTSAIAQRFIALGAPPDRVEVIPTVKYDAADFSDQVPGMAELARAVGIQGNHQVFVGGSTGPGEEEILLQVYQTLSSVWPNLRLAIAPRKPEVVAQVHAAIEARGLHAVHRSTHPDGGTAQVMTARDVLLLDTMGELKKLYGVAMGVFSGRSLVKLGGSDMIEVAAMAKPVCFGPHTFNFAEAVDTLTAADAAVEVHDESQLRATVSHWLSNPAKASEMGHRGRTCLENLRGSTTRYASDIVARLRTAASPHRS